MNIVDNFDAASAADPNANDEVRKNIRDAFSRRITKLASAANPITRKFFHSLALAHDLITSADDQPMGEPDLQPIPPFSC
jgi:hypothetical protein